MSKIKIKKRIMQDLECKECKPVEVSVSYINGVYGVSQALLMMQRFYPQLSDEERRMYDMASDFAVVQRKW